VEGLQRKLLFFQRELLSKYRRDSSDVSYVSERGFEKEAVLLLNL
jgi:hypothetical protein